MAVKWDCNNGEQCCQQEPRSYSTDDLASDIIFEDGRSASHEPKNHTPIESTSSNESRGPFHLTQ